MGAGESWRVKRESLGRTLEDISQELRISRRYLQGIEEGNFSRWPPKVFSAGFIRAYARLLEEDPEPVLSEYYEVIASASPEHAPVPGKPEWIEMEHRRGSRRRTYLLAAAGVFLVGVALAWYSKTFRPTAPPPPETAAPAAQLPSPQPAPPGDAPAAAPGAGPLQPLPGPAARKAERLPEGPGKVAPPYQLFLEANELTWVMYSRDGAEPTDVMLYPGERIGIQAREKILLKVGNAGGVAGTLNGKVLPPFGERGEVREIRFGE